MTTINDLQAGKAGEYLVCADLILKGYIAFLSEQGLSFDVLAEVGGRLAKIQVKTTRAPNPAVRNELHKVGYLFNIDRMGKGGSKKYETGTVDIFALVGLDTRVVGYLAAKDIRQTMRFRVERLKGTYRGEEVPAKKVEIVALRESGMSFATIGKIMGVDPSYAWRVAKGKENLVRGKYLGDLTFEDAAFRAGFITNAGSG